MNNNNKSYRINTKLGSESEDIKINLNILQNYDILEILSLKIGTENIYKTHVSGYGCVVGRVLANGGVGVPNAKISIFIEADEETLLDEILYNLYPYKTTGSKNSENIRYNLLPDEKISECHQIVGTFPNKRLVLDDKHVLEIFETYYKYTTVTNESGDYMLFGIPTGNQTLHMDLDLSDIGFLSQKPIDMKYKGYNNTMFENSMQFKTDTNLDNLIQIISQNNTVYVKPFWGEENAEEIGITRFDIDVSYKFEPTCIFIGSLLSDDRSNGFSKKCVPSRNMGRMNKLSTGHGTIEMIRKRIDGSVEDYPILGNELIDENGVWCYQIPMNLDYVITDEYGNLVPTDNPEKGLPTRTRVRFRVSLSDFDSDTSNNHLSKMLVPNNPKNETDIDYTFGSFTLDDDEGSKSFRDLFWNNVYTVKSFVPRIQKGNNQRTEKFSGIKNVNVTEGNNPIPYNNMRVNITFMFTLQCAIIKSLIFFVKVYNKLIARIPGLGQWDKKDRKCAYIGDGLCPDLEGWYFAPGCGRADQLGNSLTDIVNTTDNDNESIDEKNKDDDEKICVSNNITYFMQCLEINLALENDVIQFDFYNDWVNGLIYLPRWYVNIKKKASFLFGLIRVNPKIQACMEDTFKNVRKYTQQCSIGYSKDSKGLYTKVTSYSGCKKNKQKCHKKHGRKSIKIFGNKGGIIHQENTLKQQNVYYVKPCEWINNKKCHLFATDLVLLGNINKCNLYGIPNSFEGMTSSTFQIPPSLVQTNMDSDGILYGIKGKGISKCNSNTALDLKIGVEAIEQTVEGYQKWENENVPLDDITEYAVAEISGIDWGLSGPNQKNNNENELYYPGGHFLGISCANAQVNVKSCVNLSRICEIGAMMSQRQAKVSYEKLENGEYKIIYKYIIPTGLISRDEISDNNFRNIFATLNYNGLKTKKTEYGLREYDFISLQPINFNGDLSGKIQDVAEYNEMRYDNGNNEIYNASAYTRTIEESSKDYYFFRLGVNEKSAYENSFLLNEGNKHYLPVYENSYYFYYGLKNGATAIDKFLTEYYAQCPNRGEQILPEIGVNVENKKICSTENSGGTAIITFKNIPTPIKYTIFHDGELYKEENNYFFNEIKIDSLNSGNYSVTIENSLYGINKNKSFKVEEILPINGDEYNLYENSCFIDTVNFQNTPKITFNDGGYLFNVKPDDNGGLIILNVPRYIPSLKPPYVCGYAVTCNGKIMGFSYGIKNATKNRIFDAVEEKTGINYERLSFNNINVINSKNELYNVGDKTINVLHCEGEKRNFLSFKAWEIGLTYDFYVCYSCKGPDTIINDTKAIYVGSNTVDIDYEKLSYYLYDENILLQNLDENNESVILNTIKNSEDKIAYLNYNNLGNLTPYEEWVIKKSLYFNGSYYNGDSGNINFGIINGKPPYDLTIKGTCEYFFEGSDDVTLIESTNKSQAFPVDIDNIIIPTRTWLSDLYDANGNKITKSTYTFTAVDSRNAVPYMSVKESQMIECK